jgi:hypothetical protein
MSNDVLKKFENSLMTKQTTTLRELVQKNNDYRNFLKDNPTLLPSPLVFEKINKTGNLIDDIKQTLSKLKLSIEFVEKQNKLLLKMKKTKEAKEAKEAEEKKQIDRQLEALKDHKERQERARSLKK